MGQVVLTISYPKSHDVAVGCIPQPLGVGGRSLAGLPPLLAAAGHLAPNLAFANSLLHCVAKSYIMNGGKRYRIVMDPARWGKRTGPRITPKVAGCAAVGSAKLRGVQREICPGLPHITPASERGACLLDWDKIAELFIRDVEARRKGGNNNGQR